MARRITFKTAAITALVVTLALIGVSRIVSFHAWPPDSAATPAPEMLVVPRKLTGATGAVQASVAPLTLSPAAAAAAVSVPALGALQIPVQGVEPRGLVDTFSQARAAGTRVHDAIDIMAPRGTPVLAAAAGRLERLFASNEGGNTIYIRTTDRRVIFYYAHLDSYAPGLAEGQAISAGQIIGAVGFSGNANPAGPHLHFAINVLDPADAWWKGTPINPYPLLMAR